MFDARITRFHKGPYGDALAFFDVAVGDLDEGKFTGVFLFKGLVLREKKDGSAYFYQVPSKVRMKGGKPVLEEKTGKKQYDNHIELYGEQVDGEWQIPGIAWEFRKRIIDDAVARYTGGNSQVQNEVSQQVDEAPANDAFEDNEDDDLPF